MGNVTNALKGAKALAELLGESCTPANNQLAQARANICLACPLNKPAAGWMAQLGRAGAAAVRQYFRHKKRLRLQVQNEADLQICAACDCSLKLKVHVELDHILQYTSELTLSKLHDRCWILSEMEAE